MTASLAPTRVIFVLAAALLTSFNPILYKQIVAKTGPVAVVWG